MKVQRLVAGPVEVNCWIAGDASGGPALVIDPGGDAGRILEALQDRTVEAIVLTHGHFDHFGGVSDLMAATGAPLAVHRLDAEVAVDPAANLSMMTPEPFSAPAPDIVLDDGDVVRAGEVALAVLHTPGHTPGSICLLGDGHLFSGDTLFAGSVGRTDFPGGDGGVLAVSIREKLVGLPDETLVHPGHGDESTIGRERTRNMFWPRG